VDALIPLLLAHAAATLAMTGLAWFVQVVHYPLFARVGAEGFADYEREHQRRTSWIVVPAMLAEATCAAALLWVAPGDARTVAGAALLAAIWASTFLVQVPLHARLERGFDLAAQRRLVATSWIRTVAWSARGLLALALLAPG
jgi:hypothetical protein